MLCKCNFYQMMRSLQLCTLLIYLKSVSALTLSNNILDRNRKQYSSSSNFIRDVPEGGIYWWMDGSFQSSNTLVYGDGIISIYHIPFNTDRWRKREQNKRRNENNGIEGFGVLVFYLKQIEFCYYLYWNFRLSWFIIYGIFVLFLSIVCCVLLFTLQVFQNTNFLLIFLLVLFYSLSIIMFGFMITPFFDKSRVSLSVKVLFTFFYSSYLQTAGILGNFAVNIMSLFYFIQVFVDHSSSVAFWIVSLISSSGFALAMDKVFCIKLFYLFIFQLKHKHFQALVMELNGEGVNFDNLWSGPGMPFGGSLIMMALDIVLYGLLAYYLDCVIPSTYFISNIVSC